MKKTCRDCKQKRHCRPVTKHVDGTIDYVCKICWDRLSYDNNMHPEDCGCPHCESQRSL